MEKMMNQRPAESSAFTSLRDAKERMGVGSDADLLKILDAKLKTTKGKQELLGEFNEKDREAIFNRLSIMHESLGASIDASKKMEAPENKGILRRVGGHLWRNKGKYILGATAAAVVGAHLLSFNFPAAIESALSSVPYDKVKDFIGSLLPLGKGSGVFPVEAVPSVPGDLA